MFCKRFRACLVPVCAALMLTTGITPAVRGQGDAPDLLLTRKAAAGGDLTAMFNLGIMYLNGEGVPQNGREAFKWFLRGAEAGEFTRHVESRSAVRRRAWRRQK